MYGPWLLLFGLLAPEPARLKLGFVPRPSFLLPSSWVPPGASYSGVWVVSDAVRCVLGHRWTGFVPFTGPLAPLALVFKLMLSPKKRRMRNYESDTSNLRIRKKIELSKLVVEPWKRRSTLSSLSDPRTLGVQGKSREAYKLVGETPSIKSSSISYWRHRIRMDPNMSKLQIFARLTIGRYSLVPDRAIPPEHGSSDCLCSMTTVILEFHYLN